jgi:hypothetical protein
MFCLPIVKGFSIYTIICASLPGCRALMRSACQSDFVPVIFCEIISRISLQLDCGCLHARLLLDTFFKLEHLDIFSYLLVLSFL